MMLLSLQKLVIVINQTFLTINDKFPPLGKKIQIIRINYYFSINVKQ